MTKHRGISLKRVYPKVGRNDECPCGATWEDGKRKKFKHCCIQGEWANDYIDVYNGLLHRNGKWLDLNNKEHVTEEKVENNLEL